MRIQRLPLVGLLASLVLAPACGPDNGNGTTPVAADASLAEPGVPSTSASTPSPAVAAVGSPEVASRKVLTYENVTLSVPDSWRISVNGDVAGLGDFVSRPGREGGPSLVVSVNSPGPIDDVMPTRCERGPATAVDLVQAGFAPVGDRTADFRFWISTCDDGSTEERRAWVLPASRISFVEAYHVPENVEVVTTASVA